MLQRRGVEDDVGALLGEDALDPGGVADVAQQLAARHAGPGLGHLAVDVEQVVFRGVDHGQVGAAAGGDLAAQLRTDAAAGPGDQHAAARDQGADGLGVEAHRRTAEQLLDADFAQGGGGRRIGAHLDHAMAAQQAHALGLQPAQALGAEGAHGAVGQEQDGRRRQAAVAQAGQHAVEVGDGAQHADAAQLVAGLAVQRRDHADRGVAFAKARRGAQEGLGFVGRADDQEARQGRLHRGRTQAQDRIEQLALVQAAADDAQGRQEGGLDQGRAGDHAQAAVDAAVHEAGDDQEGDRGQHRRAEQAQVVAGRDEAPGRALDAEQQFDDQRADAVIARL